jgi:hypothetical protein
MEEPWLELENEILCVQMKMKKKNFGLSFFLYSPHDLIELQNFPPS